MEVDIRKPIKTRLFRKTFSSISQVVYILSLNLGTMVLILLLGNFFLGFAKSFKHYLQQHQAHVAERQGASILEIDFKKHGLDYSQYEKEINNVQLMTFRPYYQWRRPATSNTKSIIIENDGTRRTLKNPNKNAKKIFMFGGSTMWGTGSPDSHTIPSLVQQNLGTEYDVYNFGEAGFVSTQSLNLLLEKIAFGNIPDTVIFYEGANDSYANVYSPANPRNIQVVNAEMDRILKNPWWSLFRKTYYYDLFLSLSVRMGHNNEPTYSNAWDAKIFKKLEENLELSKTTYLSHIKVLGGLAKTYGFKIKIFWQPVLITNQKKIGELESTVLNGVMEGHKTAIQKYYKLISEIDSHLQKESENNFFNLSSLFLEDEANYFFDWCHVSPSANIKIANAIVDLGKLKI